MGVSFFVKKQPSGPVLIENFTEGIGDWIVTEDLGNANVTWFNGNSMRHYANSSGIRSADAAWTKGIGGDFDIEVEFDTTNRSTAAGDYTEWHVFMKPVLETSGGTDYVRIFTQNQIPGTRSTIAVSSSTLDQLDWPTYIWTGKFRFTRTGNLYTTYYDTGSGWVSGLEYIYGGWTTMYLRLGIYVSGASMTTLVSKVTVNEGTIVS